jgi:hypothetical protein
VDNERILEKKLHELGELLGNHVRWAFLAFDQGALVTFSNQRPEQIRTLAKAYLGQRAHKEHSASSNTTETDLLREYDGVRGE